VTDDFESSIFIARASQGDQSITMPDDLSLSKIIHRIILAPSVSSPLARATILKMLDRLNKPELKDRIFASTILFRGQ
jgi:hypothetical protein